ncbi:MAG: (2Fe-2S)-binding protein [Candidatus Neomarinimicrobiota bacterium]|nr:MAG: (2Fe-2S)-binding protein [Candidatus Neomarinimicrobiota bacterium]
MSDPIVLHVTVNGRAVTRAVDPALRLIDFLREELRLTGTKESCGEGECGSCTVLLNGKPVTSCLILAVETEGQEITTIEGLAEDGLGAAVQEAFIRDHAVQCGYCIPGMVLMGAVLRRDHPDAGREELRTLLAGNLCRCTGYEKILDAILDREEDR